MFTCLDCSKLRPIQFVQVLIDKIVGSSLLLTIDMFRRGSFQRRKNILYSADKTLSTLC